MTNYHPDVQRAYESHCADGYVVPDDETGPQEATGADRGVWGAHMAVPNILETTPQEPTSGPVRDFPCSEALGDGKAAERRSDAPFQPGQSHPDWRQWACDQLAAKDEEIARLRSLADDYRDVAISQTVNATEQQQAKYAAATERDQWRRTAIGRADGLVKAGARLYHAWDERDRARDTAAALEAEVASLRREGEFREQAEARARRAEDVLLRVRANVWDQRLLGIIDDALADTNGEATSRG